MSSWTNKIATRGSKVRPPPVTTGNWLIMCQWFGHVTGVDGARSNVTQQTPTGGHVRLASGSDCAVCLRALASTVMILRSQTHPPKVLQCNTFPQTMAMRLNILMTWHCIKLHIPLLVQYLARHLFNHITLHILRHLCQALVSSRRYKTPRGTTRWPPVSLES